jgi:hypothetical protein
MSRIYSTDSLVVQLFTKGVALYGAFIAAVIFMASGAAMQMSRGIDENIQKLGQLSYFDVGVKSFLPGFSFGSELFVIVGIWKDSRGIAVTMLLFRLLHLCGGITLFTAIFGNSRKYTRYVQNILPRASVLNREIDKEFSRTHVPFVSAIALLTMCDVSMVQFLPWKRSTFYTTSRGYANIYVMKFVLGSKMVQAFVSVICQLAYLAMETDVKDPTTSPQAKPLFILNIIFSVTSVVVGLMLLFLKNKLLKSIQQDHDEKNSDYDDDDDKIISSSSSSSPSSSPEAQVAATTTPATIQMQDLFSESGEVGLGSRNPLHGDTKNNDSDLMLRLSALTRENEVLERENRKLKSENCNLSFRLQSLVVAEGGVVGESRVVENS